MPDAMTEPTSDVWNRGTMLVVDDEPEILTALEDLFEEDFRVHVASSGAQALEILRRAPEVEVIISDQRMPGMTGDAFLAQARNITQAEALLLTGFAELEAVISAVNTGRIAFYAHKPWDAAALRHMVRSAVERHRLARALETERALLRGLLDASADALSFKDRDGRFVRLNAAKARALGSTVEALLGQQEARLLPPGLAAEMVMAEQDVWSARQATDRTGHPAGDENGRWLRVQRLPILDRAGQPTHLATIEHDLTRQRQLEERLRQAEKMQALGTMAGGVAHDFNNLLTAIMGSLDLMLHGGAKDQRQEMLLNTALAAAERGSSLTRRLLSFSRKHELEAHPADLNRLTLEMESLLDRSLGNEVSIVRVLDQNLWPAMADAEQFGLAVLNLCINSRDAMPDGGTITLSTRNATVRDGEVPDLPPGDYAVLSVADTGSGMPPEIMAKAFEPFFTTKDIGKGTGLGLSMVYGLARQLGGTATLASRPGHGTVVELFLPRSSRLPQPKPEDAAKPPAATGPAHILVVDDDAGVRNITATFLSELGHSTREAADGMTALAMLAGGEPIDLLVTDYAMPGMNGIELAQQVKARWPKLPVLLLTGYADPSHMSASYPVLRKPFRQSDLAREVGAALALR
jgi:PAS domain S-box-containing protein